jgi:hypothetical protein
MAGLPSLVGGAEGWKIAAPSAPWKFSASDARERQHWDEYMSAYEDAIRSTATEAAPWYAVPADNKWFTGLVVCAAVSETLAGFDLAYPRVDKAKREELAAARRVLLGKP